MTPKQKVIRERLRGLEDEAGFLDLDRVIEAAKNPDDPMHNEFTWDVKQAALEHWKNQARAMIRKVRYVETITKVELDVSKYVSVSSSTQRAGYMSLDRVRDRKEIANEVFNEEIKRARAALERARSVADILDRRDDLEKVISWIVDLQRAAA